MKLSELKKYKDEYCTKEIMYQNKIIFNNDVKTNWQVLINLYNDNTRYNYEQEIQPDLPVPDYTKLAE